MTYLVNAVKNMVPKVPTRQQYAAKVANSTVPLNKPQTTPLHDEQVKNNAGGYVFAIDDILYFQRFLFLGSEKGTYYVSEQKLTADNVECIERLLAANRGEEMLSLMRRVNDENRAAKSGPMLFALAYIAKMGDLPLRKEVYTHLHEFLRIPTQLFEFLTYAKEISKSKKDSVGWGRLQRQFIQSWYEKKDVDTLSYQVTKYQQRDGWSHRDVFRLAHVVPVDAERVTERALLYRWIVKKEISDSLETDGPTKTGDFLRAFGELQKMTESQVDEVVKMIAKYRFVREHIPTNLLNSKPVWEALLQEMPLGALIRNLNKLTKLGIFDGYFTNDQLSKVCDRLRDEKQLSKARIHPLKLIVSMRTYSKGRGEKGSLTWEPNQKILDALNDAYYASFKYAKPTGKRFFIGLDVSGSMGCGNCAGTTLTPREASACLALTLLKLEPNCILKGFSSASGSFYSYNSAKLVDLPISPGKRLDDNIKVLERIPFGATDLSLPVRYADEKNIPVDCFIILSDNETWFGNHHPSDCLRAYRKKMNIPTCYVNVQMTATKFSVADPADFRSLEIAGFDSGMLETISEFVSW